MFFTSLGMHHFAPVFAPKSLLHHLASTEPRRAESTSTPPSCCGASLRANLAEKWCAPHMSRLSKTDLSERRDAKTRRRRREATFVADNTRRGKQPLYSICKN